MQIINLMKRFIGIILNHSPLLHVSTDNQFGSFCPKERCRISIFAVDFGLNKYYFFTWEKRSLKWFHSITLHDFLTSSNQNSIEAAASRYEEMITSQNFKNANDKNALERHKEYLKERTGDFRNSYTTMLGKVNNYSAICVAFVAFLGFLLTRLVEKISGWPDTLVLVSIAFLAFGIYFFVNAALLVKFALQVKGAVASKFATIKEKTTDIVLNKALYIDWLSSQRQVTDSAHVLKNIEKYLIRSISYSFVAWMLLSYAGSLNDKATVDAQKMQGKAQLIEVVDCKGNVDMDKVAKVAASFEHKHIASVVHSSDNTLVDSVVPFLKVFSDEQSSQIIYEVEDFEPGCQSIFVLIKDDK